MTWKLAIREKKVIFNFFLSILLALLVLQVIRHYTGWNHSRKILWAFFFLIDFFVQNLTIEGLKEKLRGVAMLYMCVQYLWEMCSKKRLCNDEFSIFYFISGSSHLQFPRCDFTFSIFFYLMIMEWVTCVEFEIFFAMMLHNLCCGYGDNKLCKIINEKCIGWKKIVKCIRRYVLKINWIWKK